jgi:hypothetical protein
MRGVGRWVGLVVGLALWPAAAGADEWSVTSRAQHAECAPEVWSYVEGSALEEARARCADRGGLDTESLRWVHDAGPLGNERICIVHLHFTCGAETARASGRA